LDQNYNNGWIKIIGFIRKDYIQDFVRRKVVSWVYKKLFEGPKIQNWLDQNHWFYNDDDEAEISGDESISLDL
jgi:hypothetical protein